MKPNIQKLFDAIVKFNLAIQKAGYRPADWHQAREHLYKDFEALGIADSFDWSEE